MVIVVHSFLFLSKFVFVLPINTNREREKVVQLLGIERMEEWDRAVVAFTKEKIVQETLALWRHEKCY